MSKANEVTDMFGRKLQVGDIIAWPSASNAGSMNIALIREVLVKKKYWDKAALTKIVRNGSHWGYVDGKYTCIKKPNYVNNYYMYYPQRGIIVTEQLVNNPPEDEDIQLLLKAREEMLND